MLVGASRLTEVGGRVVIIVARDRPELFEYFRRGFTGVHDVGIIVDRRLPDDDHMGPDDGPDVAGRRWHPDIYDELTLRGFAIKRIE